MLSGLRILRDDVDVLVAAMRRLDNSYDRLETGLSRFFAEFREIRSELRAMHAEHDRTAARVRVLEERPI